MDTAKKGKVKEYFQNLKRQLFKDLEYLGTVTSIVSNSTRKDATEEDFEFLIYDMKKCLQQDNTESLYINQTLRKVMQSKNLYHIYIARPLPNTKFTRQYITIKRPKI